MQNPDIRAVFFDIDDTLYDQTQPFILTYRELYADRFDFDEYELFRRSRARSNEVYAASIHGEISMEEMYIYRVQKAFEDVGGVISDQEALHFQEIYAKRQRNIYMTEEMKKILSYCEKHFSTGVITNGPSAHQWNKVHDLDLLSWIPKEHIIISGDVDLDKPSKDIFHLAATRAGICPEEILFIGDSYEMDIVGAKNAGCRCCWVNRRSYLLPEVAAVKPDATVCTEEELFSYIKTL